MRDFELRGGRELAKISRELRKVGDGKQIRKQLSKDLRAAAKPLVPAVRASIMAIPTQGRQGAPGRDSRGRFTGYSRAGHSGLRQRLSKATRLRVNTTGRNAGVAILVDPKRMPNGQKALPAYMEGTKPRWRHPVFGDVDVWTQQKAHPYFYRVVNPFGRKARATVNKTLDDITKQIT